MISNIKTTKLTSSFLGGVSTPNLVLRQFSSIRLAITELIAIGIISSIGTVIEQDKPLEFYKTFYPDGDDALFGFLTWKLIVGLGLDRVYSRPAYYILIIVLGISLLACTITRQWPIMRIARRSSFSTRSEQIYMHVKNGSLSGARLNDFGRLLGFKGYQVLVMNDSLYAFKGIVGRYAPILVHAALIIAIIGIIASTAGCWRGVVMTPIQGDFLVINHITPATPFAIMPSGAKAVVKVNNFTISYLGNGQIDQFYTDLSVREINGNEFIRKSIFVNMPLRFGGISLYQTDWDITALVLSVKGESMLQSNSPVSVPVAPLNNKLGSTIKSWASFIPAESASTTKATPRGISIVISDLQSAALYDSNGIFKGIRSFSSKRPILIDGIELTLLDVLGSTGIELKSDPAVTLVYVGFGLVLVSTFLSSISFCQIWALQEKSDLHIGGKSNRVSSDIAKEIDQILLNTPHYLN